MKELGSRQRCAVDPSRRAVFDAAHRAHIGHEIYFFSSIEARDRILHHPLRWCGVLTDPVSQVRFRPTAGSPRTEYSGRVYYFADAGNRAAFLASPVKFAEAKRSMSPPRVE